jgi:hypothetical protein
LKLQSIEGTLDCFFNGLALNLLKDFAATVYTELLDNGEPSERVGRKATGLTLPLQGRHGSRAAEGNGRILRGSTDCPKFMIHGG